MTEHLGGTADLHAHTWYSDGKHSPAEVVKIAARAGLKTIAITDHETAAGVEEAKEEGTSAGVEVVPGVEFSARIGRVESHFLGLWIDPDEPGLVRLMEELRGERIERAKKMVERLAGQGVAIGMDDVLKVVGKGSIGRPHIAQALVDVGAVESFKQAFKDYIGRDSPAYVERMSLDPVRAIGAIHAAGGVAVLAHGLIGGPQREHVVRIAEMGLDAVEIYHPKLKDEHTRWLREFASQKGLGISGGSDWHGEGWSDGQVGRFTVDDSVVADLLRRRKRYPV